MASNERIKKYLDAGSVLGHVTRARAEEIVRELVSAGDIQRGQAQEWIDNLVDRSRKSSEQILDLIRHEVSTQLARIETPSIDNIAGQVADILRRSADAGRAATAAATAGATAQASKTAQAARSAAGKVTPARITKARAKTATAKPAKQAAKATKSAAKKAVKKTATAATKTTKAAKATKATKSSQGSAS